MMGVAAKSQSIAPRFHLVSHVEHHCPGILLGFLCILFLRSFPVQAYAFLGSVAAFLVILVVFFLYLNKKLCFTEIGGFPCCDKTLKKHEPKSKELGRSYNYDQDQDSSSDSDDEILRRLQESMSAHSILRASIRSTTATVLPHQNSVSKDHGTCDEQRGLIKQGQLDGQGIDVQAGQDSDLIINLEDGDHPGGHLTIATDPHGQSMSSADAADVSGNEEDDQPLPEGSGGKSPTLPSGQCMEASVPTFDNQAFREDETGFGKPARSLSAYGETAGASDADEHLFDVSDLQAEPHLISRCGTLHITQSYNVAKRKMTITISCARDIPSKDRGGASQTQVRVLLLPQKKQKFKTKIRPGVNPIFNETCVFNKVDQEDVGGMGVRFRLYGCERMRRERMIGEAIISFAMLNLDEETTHVLHLEPRSNLSHGDSSADVGSLSRSDSASSTQSMQHGGVPELMIGLSYSGTTGRLQVDVIKGSHFRNMAMNRAPDTYVKVSLMASNGTEMSRSKTSIRRGQPNPLYKETFMFQVALFQLADVTLMVSVYSKRSMKRKEMVGWFSLGKNNSGEEELNHWKDMRESKGELICRWHVLLEA